MSQGLGLSIEKQRTNQSPTGLTSGRACVAGACACWASAAPQPSAKPATAANRKRFIIMASLWLGGIAAGLGYRLGLHAGLRHHVIMRRRKTLERQGKGKTLAIIGHDIDFGFWAGGFCQGLDHRLVRRHLHETTLAIAHAVFQDRRSITIG